MIEMISVYFFIAVLIILSVFDTRYGIIPNKIVYPAIIVTIALVWLSPEASLKTSLIGGATLAAFLLVPVLLLRSMGLGDVKLAFLIGLMTGFPEGVVALYGGIALGGLCAIFLLVFRLKERRDEMPYGPFLVVGAIVVLLAHQYSLFPSFLPV